jgi:hypothetical protein
VLPISTWKLPIATTTFASYLPWCKKKQQQNKQKSHRQNSYQYFNIYNSCKLQLYLCELNTCLSWVKDSWPKKLIDWLVLSNNFNNISAISWRYPNDECFRQVCLISKTNWIKYLTYIRTNSFDLLEYIYHIHCRRWRTIFSWSFNLFFYIIYLYSLYFYNIYAYMLYYW